VGGECEIGNRADGGLQVAMTFPFDIATRPVEERRAGPQHEERVS
jgi:two-component system osmolarity sensor histidine kinase EnvZ